MPPETSTQSFQLGGVDGFEATLGCLIQARRNLAFFGQASALAPRKWWLAIAEKPKAQLRNVSVASQKRHCGVHMLNLRTLAVLCAGVLRLSDLFAGQRPG